MEEKQIIFNPPKQGLITNFLLATALVFCCLHLPPTCHKRLAASWDTCQRKGECWPGWTSPPPAARTEPSDHGSSPPRPSHAPPAGVPAPGTPPRGCSAPLNPLERRKDIVVNNRTAFCLSVHTWKKHDHTLDHISVILAFVHRHVKGRELSEWNQILLNLCI